MFPNRKGHLEKYMEAAHVKGIGGPGAPHTYDLSRIGDLGSWLNQCPFKPFVNILVYILLVLLGVRIET